MCNLNLTMVGIIVELSAGNIIRDIIGLFNARRMNELEDQANTDPLTGLYNRRYADFLFRRLLTDKTATRICVASMDIDDFKLVNDAYGHGVGDVVLTAISQHMVQSLRRSDVVFRWGGEEFLILLDDTDMVIAQFVMEKLRKELSQLAIQAGDLTLSITVTIGVAPLDLADVEGSIKKSDDRLYYGKTHGKNQVVAN
ncbi:GGDEF domain-containing protein [Eubacteriales bacterium OttesenSCG-928-M02]|nr:GGDEF domain-containing protein [Eubacteriales bacterium OttesenSCG-928-M02]